MSALLHTVRAGSEEDFVLPVAIGGGSGAALHVGAADGIVATLEQDPRDGRPVLRPGPAATAELSCNGAVVPAQGVRLHAGDQLVLGGEPFVFGHPGPELFSLTAAALAARADGTVPPSEEELTALTAAARSTDGAGTPPPPPAAAPHGNASAAAAETIAPVSFRRSAPQAKRARRLPWQIPVALVGAVFVAGLWFVFTARSVTLDIDPPPDRILLSGGGWRVALADRRLMRPGRYRLTAQRAGYYDLETRFEVDRRPAQTFSYEMEKLPGRVTVVTEPPEGVEIAVDGEVLGRTPLAPQPVAAGEHSFSASAPRYQPAATTVDVEGLDRPQQVQLVLEPDWADVTVLSDPAGATISVDGEALGTTPATVEVLSGTRQIELKLSGYKRHRQFLQVRAGRDVALDPVTLAAADGLVMLRSDPAGALVTVDGRFRGQTPIELELTPDRRHQLRFTKAGYQPYSASVTVPSGEERALAVEMQAVTGTVVIEVEPADAEVLVGGRSLGRGRQVVDLPAIEQTIEVRRAGYAPATAQVTPQQGFEQEVSVALLTREDAAYEAIPKRPLVGPGIELQFVDPAEITGSEDGAVRFTMGSSRRDPDRLANEAQYEVELRRAFYVSTTEITNAQYRAWRRGHRSGALGKFPLDGEQQPVVQVAWADAAAFCNWLSRQEGLPPAYVDQDGQLVAASPMTTGYRLPTEAEWAWISRFAGGEELKFPWGERPPPPPNSGNYAGAEARPVTGSQLRTYEDQFVVSAPVATYPPGRLGFFDLGGNVAEWVHDFFGIRVEPGPFVDPLGPDKGRYHVVRGASYLFSGVTELRLTYRDFDDQAREDLGFRVARYYQ